jgi:hypothetical protein
MSALMLAMNYAPPKVQRMLVAYGATLEPTDYVRFIIPPLLPHTLSFNTLITYLFVCLY